MTELPDGWEALNRLVMSLHDEASLQALLARELAGRRRRQWLLRIHSRFNLLRARRERQELETKAA